MATVVSSAQLTRENGPTVVVPTDVVYDEQQHEFVGIGAHQGHPQRQLVGEIEWPAELISRHALDPAVPLRVGKVSQIMCRPTEFNVIGKNLIRLTLAVHAVYGAQDCVTCEHVVESNP